MLCLFGAVSDFSDGMLLRAAAFSYGAPMCLCGTGYSLIADVTGEELFASPDSPVEFSFEKKSEYHLIETRRRGFCKPEKGDF